MTIPTCIHVLPLVSWPAVISCGFKVTSFGYMAPEGAVLHVEKPGPETSYVLPFDFQTRTFPSGFAAASKWGKEASHGFPLDFRVGLVDDMWSVGVLAYEIFTGLKWMPPDDAYAVPLRVPMYRLTAPLSYSLMAASGVPPGRASSVPPAGATSVPPEGATGVPPDGAAGVPPGGAAEVPPDEASGIPPDGAVVVLPYDATEIPPDAASTVPHDDAAGVPPDQEEPHLMRYQS
jgi:hypothetical protein